MLDIDALAPANEFMAEESAIVADVVARLAVPGECSRFVEGGAGSAHLAGGPAQCAEPLPFRHGGEVSTARTSTSGPGDAGPYPNPSKVNVACGAGSNASQRGNHATRAVSASSKGSLCSEQ